MADSIWGTGRRLDDSLYRDAYEFEFFQAVRLLLLAESEPGRVRTLNETVRFRVQPSIAFPPSPVVQIEPGTGSEPAAMTIAFMGLIGPSRVLPDSYTEFSLRQRSFGDESFGAFFDIFHHRLLSLYYRAWEKHQFAIGQERAHGGRDAVTGYLLDLIGMGTAGLEDKLPFGDEALLRYAGLLAQRPRSAECLRALLSDWLGMPVKVQQFCGQWHRLAEEELTVLGSGGPSSQLGVGAVAGDMVWALQSLIRVVLGPLSVEDFFEFLPDGARFEEVTGLIRFFLGPAIEFALQPVLTGGTEPRWAALGQASARDNGRGSRLGWSSWLTDEAFSKPATDAVFAENQLVGAKE